MARRIETSGRRRYADVAEGAAYLCTTEGGLRQRLHRGELPYIKLGRRVLLDLDRIDEVLEGGALTCIMKPLDMNEVLTTIKKAIKAQHI